MRALDRPGKADNTLLIFTSDNGPHGEGKHDRTFFDSSNGLKGFKRDMYEGGVRVPLVGGVGGAGPAGACRCWGRDARREQRSTH